MKRDHESQANQILEAAKRSTKRYYSWEERLHPELLALDPLPRKELLARARVEAIASAHLLWQLAVGVSVCLISIFFLQHKFGIYSGGLGFAGGYVVVTCIRHWHLYRATREQLRQFQLFQRATRGEA